MSAGNEFGDFLKARRAALAPDGDGPRRHVPGLRREEIAARAGVSTDYYTRLEQGPHGGAAAPQALAAALLETFTDHPAFVCGRRTEVLEVTGAEDQTLFLYSTEKGSDSEARLRTLASWLAENQPGAGSMPVSESMS
jgi:transcriptional regulator with XRE-family HTH domain